MTTMTTAEARAERFAAAFADTVRDWGQSCPGPMLAAAIGCRPRDVDRVLDSGSTGMLGIVQLAGLFGVSASQLLRAAEERVDR